MDVFHPRKKLRATDAMEFARKSIMQHASASPQTAINKINKVTAENNGRPSLMDLLTASDVEDSNQSFVGSSQQSSTKPVTPFTFESRPLPPLNTANTQPKSDIPGRNTQSLLQPKGKPETVSYLNDPSKAGNSSANSDDHAEATGAKEALALDGSSDMKQKTLNLRTNMREELMHTRRGQPIPNSTSIPRTSITRRAAPYKVPTINERESLRSSRTPQFRARPLDPKVFTGAGDVGVPRIRKLPLTVPVSPVFSKPRVKDTVNSSAGPHKTAAATRMENLIKARIDKLPTIASQSSWSGNNRTGTKFVKAAQRNGSDSTTNTPSSKTLHCIASSDQVRTSFVHPAPSNKETPAHESDVQSTTTAIYPFNTASRAAQESRFKAAIGLPAGIGKIRGPPIREEISTSITALRQPSDGHAEPSTAPNQQRWNNPSSRALTQPVPFKFATDEILRRRRAMFQPRDTTATTAGEAKATNRNKQSVIGVIKRPLPPLKRLTPTVPVPFQLATQRRAEIHMHQHGSGAAAQTTSVGARRPSRLAGLAPLRSSIPSGHTSGAIRKSQFKPTVPISPKLGQRVPVRALQPTRFLLKKSTKELTQPHEFRFHSDQRAREREQFEQSAKKREQELLELKQKAPELHRQREQRMRVRESMERSFHAGPIKHYQPITIHKATKPLTKPMSPMIGEKRKRHEMETQYLEQQQHTTHLQGSYGDIQTNASYAQSADDPQGSYLPELNAVVEPEVYREFEEAKILQEQHRALQEQLTRQERRQLELANSYHATIHQPPIRLSFPLDPAFEALQTSDSRANSSESADAEQPNAEQPNVIPSLPPLRDSFGGSGNHRLSRELRRISLEASRGSGGGSYRRRLSDIASRTSGGRVSGSGSGRSSLEGRKSEDEPNIGGYYPFTRSQVPTAVPANPSTISSANSISLPFTSLSTSTAASTATDAQSSSIPVTTFQSTSKPTEQESEERRRSGSFIPLDIAEPPKMTLFKATKISSRLFGGAPLSGAVPLSSSRISGQSLHHSKGPLVIDRALTLNDL